jgi:hypothetical protein
MSVDLIINRDKYPDYIQIEGFNKPWASDNDTYKCLEVILDKHNYTLIKFRHNQPLSEINLNVSYDDGNYPKKLGVDIIYRAVPLLDVNLEAKPQHHEQTFVWDKPTNKILEITDENGNWWNRGVMSGPYPFKCHLPRLFDAYVSVYKKLLYHSPTPQDIIQGMDKQMDLFSKLPTK